jgi:hypothetical protein
VEEVRQREGALTNTRGACAPRAIFPRSATATLRNPRAPRHSFRQRRVVRGSELDKKKMPVPKAFGAGILVDLQQRLSCALPSFL